MAFVFLALPVTAGAANGDGLCYPPPCAMSESAPPQTSLGVAPDQTAALASAGRDGGRSAVPFVAVGLSTLALSVTAVGLRRRSHILRRSGIARPLPVVVEPARIDRNRAKPQAAIR